VHSVSDVTIHTAEPLVPSPSPLEVEIAIAKLKKYKSAGSDQIMAELIQAGGKTLIPFGIRKSCLISGRSLSFYQFKRRGLKLTVVIIVGYHCYQLHTKCYCVSFSQG
jgi:hypothetical protein